MKHVDGEPGLASKVLQALRSGLVTKSSTATAEQPDVVEEDLSDKRCVASSVAKVPDSFVKLLGDSFVSLFRVYGQI
jgi:hypothetical protein